MQKSGNCADAKNLKLCRCKKVEFMQMQKSGNCAYLKFKMGHPALL